MNPWVVLNIPETKDKDAVKLAYMAQLSKHNPEDDPEGFQRIRSAYDQVLAEIDNAGDDTPMGRFMSKVDDLYNDFSRRVSVSCWKELLEDDFCAQLATEDDAGNNILFFLLDHWYLPGEVLAALSSHFGWLDRKDELSAFIPPGFFAFIENQIQSDYPNYALFDTDKNPDRFIYLFHEVDGLLGRNDIDGIAPLIAEMEETGVRHPCLLHVKSRFALACGDGENALIHAEAAFSEYPDNIDTRFNYAQILLGLEREEEAIKLYQEIFEAIPTHFGAERGIIECLLGLGEYEEARERLLKTYDKYPSSAYVFAAMHHVSQMLVEKYMELHQENPEDLETVFVLAKHFLNLSRFDECYELLKEYASPDCHIRYYEFMGECLLHKGEAEKALEHLLKDIAIQKNYLNYIKLVYSLNELQRYQDSIRYAEEGLTLIDDDIVSKAGLYSVKGIAHHKLNQFREALAAFDAGIAVCDQLYYLYTGKAGVYKDMYMFAEAIDCCIMSSTVLPYNPEPYTIEMDIYLITEQYEKILDLFEQTKTYEISDFPKIMYYKACALSRLSKVDEAVEIINEFILSEEVDDAYKMLFYREMASISEWRGEFGQALGYIKKAIALDKKVEWPVWQLHLGQVYNKLGDAKKAMAIFKRLIKEGTLGTAPYVERGDSYLLMSLPDKARRSFEKAVAMAESSEGDYIRIVHIYSDRGRHNDALKWANELLKRYDSVDNRIQKAWVLVNLGRGLHAIRHLEEAKDDFAKVERLHQRLAYCYIDISRDYQKALSEFEVILEVNPEWPYLYEDIGDCLCNLCRYEEAIQLLTGAIEKTPESFSLYARRGEIYKDMNRHEEAVNDLQHALTGLDTLKGYWSVCVIYYWLGQLFEQFLNDAESALKQYLLSLEWNSDYYYSLLSIGYIHYSFNRYEESIIWFNKAAAAAPDEAGSYLGRAGAYMKLGWKKEAEKDYKEALKKYLKKPDSACRHANIGKCYLGLEKYEKAEVHFSLAIKSAADCADCPPRDCHEAHFGMCLYCVKTGQTEEAAKHLDTALSIANHVQYNQFKHENKLD